MFPKLRTSRYLRQITDKDRKFPLTEIYYPTLLTITCRLLIPFLHNVLFLYITFSSSNFYLLPSSFLVAANLDCVSSIITILPAPPKPTLPSTPGIVRVCFVWQVSIKVNRRQPQFLSNGRQPQFLSNVI